MPKHPFNLAKAAAMLAADGFVKGPDGILEKGGQPFALTLWAGNSDSNGELTNQVLQQEWGKLGLKVTLRTIDGSALFGPSGPYFINAMAGVTYINSNNPDPDDSNQWTSAYIPRSPTDNTCCNALGYFHGLSFQAQIDALYRAGNSTLDLARRRQIYFQIQDVLADEVPAIFLYWAPNLIVVPQDLRGFTANPFYPNGFQDIASWREG